MDYYKETSEPVATVLSRLQGVKKMAPGWYEAVCPTHNDPAKPLRVIEAVDERAVVECEDHCWLYEIVAALGLRAEDLFMLIDDIYIGSEAPKYPSPYRSE